jgi:hypothetical protein
MSFNDRCPAWAATRQRCRALAGRCIRPLLGQAIMLYDTELEQPVAEAVEVRLYEGEYV